MIRHILLCKLKDASPEATERLVDAIEGLRGISDGLRALAVGVDFKRSPISYDIAAIVDFDDREALARFSAEPRHRVVVELLRTACSAVAVVDHELP